jgi:hypothetical protein
VFDDGNGSPIACQKARKSVKRGVFLDVPFVYALPYMIPNAMARSTKMLTNGNATQRLNSVGRTGFAILDGLSRRGPRELTALASASVASLCVISDKLEGW